MCKCPRRNAEVIKAWADGAQIQYQTTGTQQWVDTDKPSWADHINYRIKPEPKPDVCSYFDFNEWKENYSRAGTPHRTKYDNVKATWDGETGKLKSVEILK